MPNPISTYKKTHSKQKWMLTKVAASKTFSSSPLDIDSRTATPLLNIRNLRNQKSTFIISAFQNTSN